MKNNYFTFQDLWLLERFSNSNVLVFGAKGKGKDLLFAHLIYLRNELHYSNMPYNQNSIICTPKHLNLNGNTFKDLINGSVKKFNSKLLYGADIYLSDVGVYLPSTEHKELDVIYPDLPLFMALSRQLGNHNIHINTQALGRCWIKVREQCDCFIRLLHADIYDKFIIIDTICYESYQSAEAGFLPNQNEAEEAQRGSIEYRSFYIKKNELLYNTNYFASVFYDDYILPKRRLMKFA